MLDDLKDRIKQLKKVAVAYSGGIDSSFLLFVANKVLGRENVLAIIANGCMMPKKDYKEAIEFLKDNDFKYIEVQYNPLEIEAFRKNHKDRCYYCKKSLMSKIKNIAKINGFENVLDGKNADDLKTYRPGSKAAEELHIISPLVDSGFSKSDIRNYSKKLGIKFWNKPSNSCLATRFPYDTEIAKEYLQRVEDAEEIIKELGIQKVRLRVHDEIARIEVNKEDFKILINDKNLVEQIKKLGFKFVTLDLEGLKSGSFD